MNTGKTLFAQLMDFLPWTTFNRFVHRYGGDRYVKSLTCAEQFRIMAFAQLTYRESLRDIEVCLSAQSAKLYHMGFRQEIKRSTLADANETRDWRIHAKFAQRLITQARKLYIGESLGFELENTACALDSTTIDLCLSVFQSLPNLRSPCHGTTCYRRGRQSCVLWRSPPSFYRCEPRAVGRTRPERYPFCRW